MHWCHSLDFDQKMKLREIEGASMNELIVPIEVNSIISVLQRGLGF